MDPWTLGLVLIVALGLGLIIYGALFDRRRNRRAREEMLSPPRRDIPQFRPETAPPQYLSELQARRPPADARDSVLSDGERAAVTEQLTWPSTVVVATGYGSKSFVTDARSGWAVLDQPLILVCGSSVDSIREVLPLMERCAMAQQSLVVAAPGFAGDVLATLEVNVIQRKLGLLAITSDKHTLATIAAHTGARPLDRGDLMAGYLPQDQLGRCGRWVASKQRSWLLATPRTTPTTADPKSQDDAAKPSGETKPE